jgi:hypothetical protein
MAVELKFKELNMNRFTKWCEKHVGELAMASVAVLTTVGAVLLVRSVINNEYDLATATGAPDLEDMDWAPHEPTRPQDVSINTGEFDYSNLENNDHITNSLRLVNACVAGDRDPEWAMPIVQDWLAQVK